VVGTEYLVAPVVVKLLRYLEWGVEVVGVVLRSIAVGVESLLTFVVYGKNAPRSADNSRRLCSAAVNLVCRYLLATAGWFLHYC